MCVYLTAAQGSAAARPPGLQQRRDGAHGLVYASSVQQFNIYGVSGAPTQKTKQALRQQLRSAAVCEARNLPITPFAQRDSTAR